MRQVKGLKGFFTPAAAQHGGRDRFALGDCHGIAPDGDPVFGEIFVDGCLQLDIAGVGGSVVSDFFDQDFFGFVFGADRTVQDEETVFFHGRKITAGHQDGFAGQGGRVGGSGLHLQGLAQTGVDNVVARFLQYGLPGR